jgi:uncharacterized protein YwbE
VKEGSRTQKIFFGLQIQIVLHQDTDILKLEEGARIPRDAQ